MTASAELHQDRHRTDSLLRRVLPGNDRVDQGTRCSLEGSLRFGDVQVWHVALPRINEINGQNTIS